MQNEDTFIHSYCAIAGVGEAAARSAFIMFDALHTGDHAGLAPLTKVHVSAASGRSAARRTGLKPA